MKRLKAPLALMGLTAVVALASLASPAALARWMEPEGTKDSGGGNAQVSEFYQMAQHFLRQMRSSGGAIDPAFPLAALETRMRSLSVIAVPGPLVLNGEKKDARNYPAQNRIELDDATWALRSPESRYQIVVRELIQLLGIDDFQYKTSERLAKATAQGSDTTSAGARYTLGETRRFVYDYDMASDCTESALRELRETVQNAAVLDCLLASHRSCQLIHFTHEARQGWGSGAKFCWGRAVVEGRKVTLKPHTKGRHFSEEKYLAKTLSKGPCQEKELSELKRQTAERARSECLAMGWNGCSVIFSRWVKSSLGEIYDSSGRKRVPGRTCTVHSLVEGYAP